jgi:CheY-like chemotaxis protein
MALQRDITHQVERDDQLRQSQKMEALGQLTSGIAHDFNNLLTVIQANVEFLTEDLADSPGDTVSSLGDIAAAAHRGTGMVKRLMALSRNEQLRLESVDLGTAIQEFGRTLRRILSASIAIEVDAPESLPPIWADRGAIEQILLNLTTNARDAMPEGGTLRIRAFQDTAQTVELEVRDTGLGMGDEVLRRAFEPFFTTKPVGKGTGLGMTMVYGLMQRHGGKVTVQSGLGEGTAVRLSFPVERRPPEDEVVPGRADTFRGRERILLVEDEDSVRRIGRRILERLGYLVTEAPDGLAALQLIEERPGQFDLIVSDRVMPRMGGDELRCELGQRGIEIRFLLTTAYPEPGDPNILQKPWTARTLSQAIRRVLESPVKSPS